MSRAHQKHQSFALDQKCGIFSDSSPKFSVAVSLECRTSLRDNVYRQVICGHAKINAHTYARTYTLACTGTLRCLHTHTQCSHTHTQIAGRAGNRKEAIKRLVLFSWSDRISVIMFFLPMLGWNTIFEDVYLPEFPTSTLSLTWPLHLITKHKFWTWTPCLQLSLTWPQHHLIAIRIEQRHLENRWFTNKMSAKDRMCCSEFGHWNPLVITICEVCQK